MDANPYAILGVKGTATTAEIKTAFRRLAMKAHPDQGGNTDKFTLAFDAMKVLTDPDKRAAFDATGFFRKGEAPSVNDPAAWGLIDSVLNTLMQGDRDPLRVDLTNVLSRHFSGEISRLVIDLKNAKRNQRRAKAMRGRWRVTENMERGTRFENVMAKMATNRANAFEEDIHRLEDGIAHRQRAIQLIGRYTFTPMAKPGPKVAPRHTNTRYDRAQWGH